jgi:hypothetical protein
MEELLKIVFKHLGLNTWLEYTGALIGICTILMFIGKLVFKMIKKVYNSSVQKKLEMDLHPFYSKYDVKKATEIYIQTNCQNISPSKEEEPSRTHAFSVKERIIPFFLKKAFNEDKYDSRFYLVLADSGMGKTTFMINLYHSYINRCFSNKFRIKLLPLGYPDIDNEIKNVKEKRNTILLLDAFDEDNRAASDYKTRFRELMDLIKEFREVVITCRTQFFPAEDEEPKETGVFKYGGEKGEYIFRKLYISPFDNDDIKKYLKSKYYIFNINKRKKANKIVEMSPNLMVRPMLLSYIDDLLESESNYDYTYQIYAELIKKWIERESKRVSADRKTIFEKELNKFTEQIAVDIYENRFKRNGLFFELKDFADFATKCSIDLSTWEMSGRSLLNRNSQGLYKFSHKSILEYFLALKTYNDNYFASKFSWDGMEQAEYFYSEFCLVDLKSIIGNGNMNMNSYIKNITPSVVNVLHIINLLIDSHKQPIYNFKISKQIKREIIRKTVNKNHITVEFNKNNDVDEVLFESEFDKILLLGKESFKNLNSKQIVRLVKLKDKVMKVKGSKLKDAL